MKQLDLENAIKAHIKRADLSQAAIARKLHYTPEQFNKWVRGVNRMPDIAIQEFSDLLGLTDEERTELFTLAGYVAVTALKKAADPARSAAPISFDSRFFIDALKDWNNHFFRWPEASDHMRSSWAGIVIHMMSAVTDRITPRGLLLFCVSLLLAIVTTQLMMPALEWPLNDADARWIPHLEYGLATLLIPLLVAFVTPPDTYGLFRLETTKQRVTFWVLKFTGALAGFWVFSMVVIGIALVSYYLYLPPLAGKIRAVLALVPLFFSYVAARRIPVDRSKMFDGALRMHSADRFFLATFLFAGPFTALFFYFAYWFLSDRRFAPTLMLLLLTGVALWEYRKQDHKSIPDPVLILSLGLFLPFSFLLYAFFFTPDVLYELPYLVIISIYFLGWTLLTATLFVRNKLTLTLPGATGLLVVVIVAGLILTTELWLGAGFVITIVLIWILWARRRFKKYFWIHSSFWAMGVTTGACLQLLISNSIPLWANGLGFLMISSVLIGWAYRASNDLEVVLD